MTGKNMKIRNKNSAGPNSEIAEPDCLLLVRHGVIAFKWALSIFTRSHSFVLHSVRVERANFLQLFHVCLKMSPLNGGAVMSFQAPVEIGREVLRQHHLLLSVL